MSLGQSASSVSRPTTYRAYATDEQVTGEGVALEVPVAGLPMRMASGAIDLLVTVALFFASFYAVGMLTAQTSDAVVATFGTLTAVLVLVVYPATLETLTRGRSVGRYALGLRIVRDDGGPITARHAITRALIGSVEGLPLFYAPALIAALIHPRGKRLGDMAAGTYAVSQRSRLVLTPPPLMPHDLAHWAQGADITTLPAGLSIAIRQFLSRTSTLSPLARATLGQQLVAEALRHVAPPPPANQHPEAILAAIVADRRRRDAQRLARAEGLRARLVR